VIARTWSGSARPEQADAYVAHLRERTFPELASIPGHRGAYVLRRPRPAIVEFSVITFWESLEAVAAFAGPDAEAAVVPAAAQALLVSYDARAAHWDVALEQQDV
jgi:heme-degrading monooxygenase HmoA